MDITSKAFWLGCLLLLVSSGMRAQELLDGMPTASERALAEMTSIPELIKQANRAFSQEDLDTYVQTLERMVELRPYEGDYRYQLAAAYARLDRKTEAYNALLTLQKQGLAYDPSKDKAFEGIQGYEVYDYIVQHLQMNSEPFGGAELVFNVQALDALIESIAYDARDEQFFVGSVHHGVVYKVGSNGAVETFVANNSARQLWGVFGLTVDSERRRLWVATSSVPHYRNFKPEQYGHSSVLMFDLDSAELQAVFTLPADGQPHLLTNLTLARKTGEVYASDSLVPAVYRIDPEGSIGRLFSAPGFTSLRGLTVNDEGSVLYFADYQLGLYGVEIQAQRIFSLTGQNLNLGGIDGVYYYADALVLIQNGIKPQRLMRLDLSADGRSIESVQPLEANRPEFSNPTFGVVNGDEMFFIANSQWSKYGMNGSLKAQAVLEPIRVMRTKLDLGRG